MAGLADPTVLIELERRREGVSAFLSAIPEELVVIASISASELLVGVLRAESPRRRAEREAFAEEIFRVFAVVPFDLQCARIHCEIRVDLERRGQIIGSYDLIVAATALAHGYPVYTHNTREFQRVPGLVVRQPNW